MGNAPFSEIYKPQIPIKQNKVVFDGNQQASCREPGRFSAPDIDDRRVETHNSWTALLWPMAKVTSVFSDVSLFKKHQSVLRRDGNHSLSLNTTPG